MAARILILLSLCLITVGFPSVSPATDIELAGESGMYVVRLANEFGAGDDDVLIIYTDTSNFTGWVRTWGQAIDETLNAVATDTDGNALICGHYGLEKPELEVARPSFILKMNTAGEVVWANEIYWSYHTVWLEDITTDSANNIYATGSAVYLEPAPSPEGGYPTHGVVFTVKLSPAGEVIWARRWSAGYNKWPRGKAIVTTDTEVTVAGYYSNPNNGSNHELLMLWYNAADGTPIASEALGFSDAFLSPTAMAAGPAGSRYVACWNSGDTDSILAKYSAGRVLQWVHGWGNPMSNRVNDVAVIGNHVFLAGEQQVGEGQDDGSGYRPPILDGLLLEYTDDVLTGAKKCTDLGSVENTYFSAIVARNADDVWVTGTGPVDKNSTYYSDASGSGFYLHGNVSVPVTSDEEECASSIYEISEATLRTPFSLYDFAGYAFSRRIFLSAVEWYVPPHIPDPKLSASVLTGQAPLTVDFDASASTVPYGSIASFAWDFNISDGLAYSTDTGLVPFTQHTFTDPGTYIVALNVTSDDGNQMPITIQITVT